MDSQEDHERLLAETRAHTEKTKKLSRESRQEIAETQKTIRFTQERIEKSEALLESPDDLSMRA